MPQPPIDLYIYLLRRDKKGVRIVSRIKSNPVKPTKIENVTNLNLPSGWANNIQKIIYNSRMMWEPWVETAASFQDLRNSLKKRGYINIPTNNQPEFVFYDSELPVANISNLTQPSVMLQNASPSRLLS